MSFGGVRGGAVAFRRNRVPQWRLAAALALAGAASCAFGLWRQHAVEAAESAPVLSAAPAVADGREAVAKLIDAYQPKAAYRDDPFVYVTVQEAARAVREHNGAIGACLVRESTGEIVERAHNTMFNPYFRSDRHAEMTLIDQYEDRMRAQRSEGDPRRIFEGLVLYTSLEPCPMCVARMISAGVRKVYYAAADEKGGMARHVEALPEFWRQRAGGMTMEPAHASPELNALAHDIYFRPASPAPAR